MKNQLILPNDQVQIQAQIEELEKQIAQAQAQLEQAQHRVYARYSPLINRIQELHQLYKSKKAAKKSQRQEQKQKGKNYKTSPVCVASVVEIKPVAINTESQHVLKKLFREAIVKVHPDKQSSDSSNSQAEQLTRQLVETYQSANLDEMVLLHHQIMNQQLNLETPLVKPSVLGILKRKKQQLEADWANIQGSYWYQKVQSEIEMETFIDELQQQFLNRVQQLEKRTRVNKKANS